MKKDVTLKDGTKAIVRSLTEADFEKSFAFFQKLPPDDKIYLRVNVSDLSVVEKRLKTAELMNVRRIAAEVDGEIVGDAALELRPYGWTRHLAEFRLIVSDDFKRRGLGMVLAGELFELAVKEGVEEMIIELMEPQENARKIFEHLGFKVGAVLKRYVKDGKGEKQDLLIMRCNLNDIWDKIESYCEEFEIQVSHVQEYA